MRRTLLKSGTVVTMDRDVPDLPRGDVLIEGERIAAVAPSIDAADAEIVDAAGRIVMPGLVNAHLHAWQTCLRGIASDWTMPDYLHNMHAGIAPGFTPDDIYVSTLVGALAQLDAGTTTLVDWCHNNPSPDHTDRAVEALAEAGIRAVFMHGSPKPDPKPGQPHFSEVPHPRGEIERLLRGRFAARDRLLTLGMAVLGPHYSVYEVCRADLRLGREFGLLCSMHVGGGAAKTLDGFPRLVEEGLIDGRCNIVHGNNLTLEELRPLVGSGATVTVTPEVELSMGFGEPLTGKLRTLGAPPSLGADIESHNGGDMFGTMRAALLALRNGDNVEALRRTGRTPERMAAPCREALEWATLGGARMAGLGDKVGSLTPGKQADIVLLRGDDLNLVPVIDPVHSIVLHANAGNVDTVFVAGRAVKRGGRLLYEGLAQRKAELAETSRRILAGAGRAH
jgi:5-methylthioadenosine/S-adenosylhomocysteine deaminase